MSESDRVDPADSVDRVEPDACSLRMWSTREESPGSTRTRSGNFGSVFLPACRCD